MKQEYHITLSKRSATLENPEEIAENYRIYINMPGESICHYENSAEDALQCHRISQNIVRRRKVGCSLMNAGL
jgi:hypothetical protein